MQHRSSLLVVVLAACNRLLGLPEVAQRDGAFYDAHIDAPFTCPDFGTLPRFAHDKVVQVSQQDCFDFSTSDDGMHALATCHSASGIDTTSEGVPGMPLRPTPGLQAVADEGYLYPRLAPEGNLATIVHKTLTTAEAIVVRRDDAGWSTVATLMPGVRVTSASELSRGPNAHVIVDVDGFLHELVDSGAGWEDRNTFQLSTYLSFLQLSADGLRIWWNSSDAVQYADRPTLDATFVERGAIPGTELFNLGFITPDCGEIYFWALDRVWVAPREL